MARKERSRDALMSKFKFFRGVFIVTCVIGIVVEQLHQRKENTAKTLDLVDLSVLSLYVKIAGKRDMMCIKNNYFIIYPPKIHVLCLH